MKRRRHVRRRRARRNPVSKGTLFLGALVIGAGALAWYLWPKSEATAEKQLPQGGGGGGGAPVPKPTTSQDQLKRIAQAAHDELEKFKTYLASNPPATAAEIAAAQAKLERLRVAYRDAAARAGLQVNV